MAKVVTKAADTLGGDVDEGYGKVADAFRRNLSGGQEVGAAVAIYRDGRKVVDLWGGLRNGVTGAPWESDTLVNVYSTTKGVAALVIALAVSRGLLSYEARVADYWPEFAQAGKSAITVRQLLAHQAGLPVITPLPTLAEIADPVRLSKKLAAQAPSWPPGRRHGYHGITFGWYASELIRQVDPMGRTLGQYFANEIAGPLGLDFHIGLPNGVDRNRVAHLHVPSMARTLLHINKVPLRLATAMFIPSSLTVRAGACFEGHAGLATFNREDVRVVEIPAANGIGTARSVAKLYGDAATGGSAIGLTPAVFQALTAPAVPPALGLRDRVLHVNTSFSLGFARPVPQYVIGSSDKAFGAPGAGGSVGFADPDTGIGFGYVMNKLGFHLINDPRALLLRQALFRDVLGARPQS